MRGLPVAILGVPILAGGSSREPRTTAGLDDSVPLNRSQDPGTLVYRSPPLQTGKYKSLRIENTEVYTGKDAVFGKTGEADKQRLANKATEDGGLRAADLGIERGANTFADALDRAVGRKH